MLFPSSSSSLPSSCWTECGRDGWNSSGPSGPQGGFEDGAHRHETTSWKGLSLREHGGAGAPCQHQTEGLWTSILGGKNCLSCFNHCCSDSLLVTAKANLIFRVKLSPQEETPSSFISLLVHLYTSSPAPQTILPSPSANRENSHRQHPPEQSYPENYFQSSCLVSWSPTGQTSSAVTSEVSGKGALMITALPPPKISEPLSAYGSHIGTLHKRPKLSGRGKSSGRDGDGIVVALRKFY